MKNLAVKRRQNISISGIGDSRIRKNSRSNSRSFPRKFSRSTTTLTRLLQSLNRSASRYRSGTEVNFCFRHESRFRYTPICVKFGFESNSKSRAKRNWRPYI